MLDHFGEYFSWLMYARLPSDALGMSCVDGLFSGLSYVGCPGAALAFSGDGGFFGPYREGGPEVWPVTVSHTGVVPAMGWPQPPPLAAAAGQSSPPAIPPWNRLIGRMNDC